MATMVADTPREALGIDATHAWRAVAERDRRYDGQFVYAVVTTGVYCRPSCEARRPLQRNVRFFSTPAEAERAGFRACRRCEPRAGAAPRDNPALERARRYLDAQAGRAVSLAELAKHAGLSPSHLQRSFARRYGVSPRAYQDARRVTTLKARLRAGDTVSRATYEAGFGSSSRVYERADRALGMTPAAYRRGGDGVAITYSIAAAPEVGCVLVAATDRGVCAVELGESEARVERALRDDFPRADIVRRDDAHAAWVQAVVDLVRRPRGRAAREILLDLSGTPFQQLVWSALRAIPPGEHRTYAEVARSIGHPRATRAVAGACAANRAAVVVPCHRVIRADGALGGYKWGADRKRRLLDAET